jgi:hypothetical protein
MVHLKLAASDCILANLGQPLSGRLQQEDFVEVRVASSYLRRLIAAAAWHQRPDSQRRKSPSQAPRTP